MRSAKNGRAWIGLVGVAALGLGSAQGQEAGPGCPDCLKHKHEPSAHAVAGTPYMAPVVTEKRGGLLGKKRHSVTVYHQVAGQDPTPVASPGAGPIGTPPAVVTTPRGESLAEAHIQAPYGPVSYGPAEYGPEGYGPDAMLTAAPGEPVPVGVMRTNFDQFQGGPAPAAASGLNGSGAGAPGFAATGGPSFGGAPAPATAGPDPRIAMWHSVIQPGGSMVAGGDKKDLLTRLTDGETPLTRWNEKRKAKRLAQYYQMNGGMAPRGPAAGGMPPGAGMPPGMGMPPGAGMPAGMGMPPR